MKHAPHTERLGTAHGMFIITALVSALALVNSVTAAERTKPVGYDSGLVASPSIARGSIHAVIIHEPDAHALRLSFGDVELGSPPPGGSPTTIRITSLLDGAVQDLDQTALSVWRHGSAYFNGPAVRVELIADAGAGDSRLLIEQVALDDGATESICGTTDDRLPSDDPRVGRLLPVICSAWLIDDCHHCLLTAGHCATADDDMLIVEFNVPLSTDGSFRQHPPPEYQFAIDPHSIQFADDGIGADWCHFGCLPNTQTGLTAYETQGAAFALADTPPPADGRDVRVTGYGVRYDRPQLNRTQETDAGLYVAQIAETIRYEVDTTGGNSGSVVIDEITGEAIAIHTSGGCLPGGGGVNLGVSVSQPDLAAAIAAPRGVCTGPLGFTFAFPAGIPTLLQPEGQKIRVVITGEGDDEPIPGTGMVVVDTGTGPTPIPMLAIGPNVYDAQLPPLACGEEVKLSFRATSVAGTPITFPRYPLAEPIVRQVGADLDVRFIDDFEADLGWKVIDDVNLTDGSWERVTPATYGLRGDAPHDADGSGMCYVTGNAIGNNDVDGGPTILESPLLDARQSPDPTISYRVWFDGTYGSSPVDDTFIVEITDDAGQTWHMLDAIGPDDPANGAGWIRRAFPLSRVPGIRITASMQIRFVAHDAGVGSIVEAAVDDVRLLRTPVGVTCELGCRADVHPTDTGDGVVNASDLVVILSSWGTDESSADIDRNGIVDIFDLSHLLGAWGPCPE